jgi:hypothetical protein
MAAPSRRAWHLAPEPAPAPRQQALEEGKVKEHAAGPVVGGKDGVLDPQSSQ